MCLSCECVFCLLAVSIEDEIKFYNLSAKIEQHIFSEYRDTGMKYKSQVRSRVSNLGDLKNPTFRQAVINGHLPPSKVAVMKTDVSHTCTIHVHIIMHFCELISTMYSPVFPRLFFDIGIVVEASKSTTV